MNNAMPQDHCPECGAPLTPGAAQGLCARCLLAGAAAATEHNAPRSVPPTLEQVAAAFPQFEVIELIGRGGMGAVYQVRQPKLDRFAALKLLPQSLAADPAFASRFEREARLLARLNHANIVAVYDHGQAGAFFYLLMEFVDGVNLRQAMRASRFTPAQALGVVPKICEALQYAHDEGVLHRDIKPENILLDAKGRVKLADFGIAKLIGDGTDGTHGTYSSHDSHLTSGAALGTPQYMAPEQRDTPGNVDHRADIYSLGVVFYELLTGELPVGKFAPPSARSAADPRVDDIVRQAMEKERGRRQGSAEEMRTQVQTVVESDARPAAATPVPIPKKTFRRALFSFAGLALLAGFALFSLDLLLPPIYFSKITFEPKPDYSAPMGYPGEIDPQFVTMQFNILQKSEILDPAIENLKLLEKWSKDGGQLPLQSVQEKLLNSMVFRQVPNSSLIEVGVYSTDTKEAANIANTIAVVYQQKRLSDLQRHLDRGLASLRDEVEKQRKRSDDAAVEMAKIRERLGVIDPTPSDYGSGVNLDEGTEGDIPTLEAKNRLREYIDAKTRFLQAKRIREAAQTRYATQMLERGIDFDPAKIWEKAEPAIRPTRFSLYRLRHAFSR